MGKRHFSIKELEQFSGIKAHTIRTWEKRYQVFSPGRSIANIRSYTLDDVTRLLHLCLLTTYGFKISDLVHLPAAELEAKIATLKADKARRFHYVSRLIIAMFTNNTEEFEAVLDESLIAWDVHATIEDVILPFLERVQILSYADSSIEVHFAVTAVRRKIILGIEKSMPVAQGAETALLFLPQHEHYDLLLLYTCHALKKQGFRTLYLGTNISLENLKLICADKKPDYLYSYIANKKNFPLDAYIKQLLPLLPNASLRIAYSEGNMINETVSHPDVVFYEYRQVGNLS